MECEFSKHLQMLASEITDPSVVWDMPHWCSKPWSGL